MHTYYSTIRKKPYTNENDHRQAKRRIQHRKKQQLLHASENRPRRMDRKSRSLPLHSQTIRKWSKSKHKKTRNNSTHLQCLPTTP
mmetsp:Transcript_40630/g.61611  ORF Transcript_40630/g.61611 Transcript_40630/m.61611 type:complete len:85 (-) Transcript_40630:80-334(-)